MIIQGHASGASPPREASGENFQANRKGDGPMGVREFGVGFQSEFGPAVHQPDLDFVRIRGTEFGTVTRRRSTNASRGNG